MERPISDGQKQWVPEDLPARQSNDKIEVFHGDLVKNLGRWCQPQWKLAYKTIYIYIYNSVYIYIYILVVSNMDIYQILDI